MTNPWEADVELDVADAARLIESQFAALAPARLSLQGVGWDNTAYEVNEAWIFRFPRRAVAAGLLAAENRILPYLAPSLPLPIPIPVWFGEPDATYPYPFSGYRRLDGITACQVTWTDAQRTALAVPLARFLATLHQIPVRAADRILGPGDELNRADMIARLPKFHQRLRDVRPLFDFDAERVALLADELAQTPRRVALPVWVHGDLYARHLLVTPAHALCGVIDWGDVHLGDPALDLALAFHFLPPAARPLFRDAYGGVDDPTWSRARFRALHYGLLLTHYGATVQDIAIRQLGEYALRCAPL